MAGTNTSSFSSIVEAAEQDGNTAQTNTTNPNTDNGNNFLANLVDRLSEGNVQKEEAEPSYMELFATSGSKKKTDTKDKDKDKVSTDSGTTSNTKGSQTQTPAENEFLTSLNDDKVVEALLGGIQAAPMTLPEGFELDIDEDTGNINLTQESLNQMLQSASVASQQSSLRQTINLIRELVPAVVEQAQNSAVTHVTNTQKRNSTLSQFDNNPALKLLADKITANSVIEDDQATTDQIKQLLADIVKTENDNVNKKNKKPDRSISTFLNSVS